MHVQLHSAVHSAAFYTAVKSYLECTRGEGTSRIAACPLDLGFTQRGALFVPSYSLLDEAINEFGCKVDAVEIRAFWRARTGTGKTADCDSWQQTRMAMEGPVSAFVKRYGDMNFDTFCSWNTGFRRLAKLDNPPRAEELVLAMERAGLGVDRSKISELMTCSCGTYLHYHWCLHACAHAKHVSKLITSFPARLSEKPTTQYESRGGRPGPGRPRKSTPGRPLQRM